MKVFYAKRLFRIWPLFTVAGVAYLPWSANGDYWNPSGVSAYSYLRVITFTGGGSPEYISAVVPGGWSIVNEVYFYLIFPVYFMFINKVLHKICLSVLLCAVASIIAAFSEEIYSTDHAYLVEHFLYFNFPTQFICFVAGVEFARKSPRDFMAQLSVYLVFSLLLLLFEVQNKLHVTSVLATAIFFLMFAVRLLFERQSALDKFAPLVRVSEIGRFTFTGYIVHFGILKVMKDIDESVPGTLSFEVALIASMSLTVMLSIFLQPITEGVSQNCANRFVDLRYGR